MQAGPGFILAPFAARLEILECCSFAFFDLDGESRLVDLESPQATQPAVLFPFPN